MICEVVSLITFTVLTVFLFEGNHMGFFVGMAVGFGLFDEGYHFFIRFGDNLGQMIYRVIPVFEENMA